MPMPCLHARLCSNALVVCPSRGGGGLCGEVTCVDLGRAAFRIAVERVQLLRRCRISQDPSGSKLGSRLSSKACVFFPPYPAFNGANSCFADTETNKTHHRIVFV